MTVCCAVQFTELVESWEGCAVEELWCEMTGDDWYTEGDMTINLYQFTYVFVLNFIGLHPIPEGSQAADVILEQIQFIELNILALGPTPELPEDEINDQSVHTAQALPTIRE